MRLSEASRSKHVVVAGYFRDAVVRGKLRPGDKLPSEPEVAARFDCSVGTVRKALGVLANEGLIRPRHGVGVFVEEKRRQNIIGVIVHNVRNPDHAHLVDHVTAAAEEVGYSVMLCVPYAHDSAHEQGTRIEMEFIDKVARLDGAGIIKCPTTLESEAMIRRHMREKRLPFVIVNDYWSDCRDVHHVCCERRSEIEMAVDHLLQLGHSGIGFHSVSSNMETKAEESFVEIMTTRGIRYAVWPQWGEELRRVIGDNERDRRITGFIAAYYSNACDLRKECLAVGLRAPEEVSIVSLSGLPDECSRPIDFTTVAAPIESMARSALNLLVQETEAPVAHLLFPPALRVGSSSGPCTTGVMAEARS